MRSGHLRTLGLTVGIAVTLAACGGGGPVKVPAGKSHVTLTIQDTPPTGITILAFQISILGATLNPVQTGGVSSVQQPVSVLDSPADVELTQLATYSTLLTEASVPENSYSGITLTFGTSRMTYQNNSGSAIGTCANGSICQVNPIVSPSTITVSSLPAFPISLYASSPGGLQLDFNLTQGIIPDLSIFTPTVTVTQLSVSQSSQGSLGMDQMNNLEGLVTSANAATSQFGLSSSLYPVSISTDNNTQFDGFSDQGLTNGFAGLQVGQRVRSQAILNPDGTLSATIVELQQTSAAAQAPQIKGTITSVDSGTEFHMVVRDELQQVSGILVGDLVTVNLAGAPTFAIEPDGLTVPPVFSFASANDLMVGQEVQVTVASGSSGSVVSTDQITLRMSDLTAKVNIINNAAIITVGNLSPLYTSAGIPTLRLGVVPETRYNNVPSLAVGQTLAARGLLFKFTETPILISQTIGPQIFY